MKRNLVHFFAVLALVSSPSATAAVQPAVPAFSGPGNAYCFGIGCPCLNDDVAAGCKNSSGVGGRLDGFGSASVSAGDLGFDISGLAPNSVTLVITGLHKNNIPFKDGRLCLTGDLVRLWKHYNSGQDGSLHIPRIADQFAAGAPYLAFEAGEMWNFQAWYRDTKQSPHSCGSKANLTNGYEVVFVP